MKLVWKLLRHHVSLPQMTGFFLAHLLGMLIVLLSIRFYIDVLPVFTQNDSFIQKDYFVISKHVGMMNGFPGSKGGFTSGEIEQLKQQDFCASVAPFTSNHYPVRGSLGMDGLPYMSSDLFFESVPDAYLDVDLSHWSFDEHQNVVPIIIPRNYLSIYNFGFAQSRSLPKVSEGLLGMINLNLYVGTADSGQMMKGKIVGFTNRLNTILVPQAFMEWSNSLFAPQSDVLPQRLIVEVNNPADADIAAYFQVNGYEAELDRLNVGKAAYFFKVVIAIVMAVGVLISLLSFYVMMLSIYLLIQKNTVKMENLLLLGYSPRQVASPYQLLTVALNLLIMFLSFFLLSLIRNAYLEMIWKIYPEVGDSTSLLVYWCGAGLFLMVSVLNVYAIRRKVLMIWQRKK